MGRQHVREGTLSIRQQKTGTLVEIPILPELQDARDVMPADHLTYLTTEYGQAFRAARFGNWFRERCNEADIPKGYAAHGLRKASATRLADAGCTDHEIMAWGGWETLKEVQRYTKAANRKRLAQGGRASFAVTRRCGLPPRSRQRTKTLRAIPKKIAVVPKRTGKSRHAVHDGRRLPEDYFEDREGSAVKAGIS